MRSERGQKIHAQAEVARERGNFEESIKLINEAISLYEEDEDYVGLSDIYGSLSLIYRHQEKLADALEAAQKGVKIARDNNLKGDLARPLFNLAKVQEELGEISSAVKAYKESVRVFQEENPTLHNRSGVLADMNIHLATCEYKAGDKTAFGRILSSIKELEESNEEDVSKYNYDVWMSGAHMKLAEVLQKDNLEEAKKHLQTAKGIIDENPELKLRKDQWEKLSKNFN